MFDVDDDDDDDVCVLSCYSELHYLTMLNVLENTGIRH